MSRIFVISLMIIVYGGGMVTCCDSSSKHLFMVTEQPKISYFNTKYFSFVNLTSRRYGRNDPFYYVGLNFHAIYPLGENVTGHAYFFELLTNVYKRSFVEMHIGFCDLILRDTFFGPALRQGRFIGQQCPFEAGVYNLYNMSIPVKSIPLNFPFTRGRVYANFTKTETGELMASGYINMELKPCKILKQYNKNRRDSTNKTAA